MFWFEKWNKFIGSPDEECNDSCMAQFLDTTAVSHELTQLIKKADEKLYLISPYLQIATALKDLIRERDSRKIDIRVVYGKQDKLNPEDLSFLQELSSVKVSFCENLHAKCYLNESTALITSMNLYQYSQQNNREMGIKVDKDDADSDLYNEILAESRRIIQTSTEPQFIVKKKTSEPISSQTQRKSTAQSGFCIRCKNTIPLDPGHPLCSNCYQSWANYSDPTYREKFCHVCGKSSQTSYAKPICYDCFKKLKK
ncbi:MAG: phospholipase D family protein [Methanoregulaceae archaeon]|nr:phospholipase D family protein [Methanoregulaceae archaeon]MDD5048771.1 phospholipase D family protein [Methanoregulaceae archaeon]